MVEAAPASPLEVTKANFLFEFVVVALNVPPQLGNIDELTEANILRKRGQPILVGAWPLDQQPEDPTVLPYRHVILCQACGGRPIASFLAEIGRCSLSGAARRRRAFLTSLWL